MLVQLVPLHFIADFHARLQLKRGSHNLFMVALDGALEGPRPLRVSGKATFEILWCDFTVRLRHHAGEGRAPAAAAGGRRARAADAGAGVPGELEHPARADADPRRGAAQPAPAGATRRSCSTRWASCVVRQQVVPLNTARDIDIFGGAPVAGARRFTLTATLERHAARERTARRRRSRRRSSS